MIELNVNKKTDYNARNYSLLEHDRNIKSKDPLISHLESLNWKQDNSYNSKFISIHSQMKGFSSGRMSIYKKT